MKLTHIEKKYHKGIIKLQSFRKFLVIKLLFNTINNQDLKYKYCLVTTNNGKNSN